MGYWGLRKLSPNNKSLWAVEEGTVSIIKVAGYKVTHPRPWANQGERGPSGKKSFLRFREFLLLGLSLRRPQ